MRESGISIAFSTTSCETANRNSCSCHPACSSSFLIYRKYPIPLLLICLLKSSHGILGIIETILLWLYIFFNSAGIHRPSQSILSAPRKLLCTGLPGSLYRDLQGRIGGNYGEGLYCTLLHDMTKHPAGRCGKAWLRLMDTYYGHITDKSYVAVQALNSQLNTEQRWHSEFLK